MNLLINAINSGNVDTVKRVLATHKDITKDDLIAIILELTKASNEIDFEIMHKIVNNLYDYVDGKGH